MMEEVKNAIVNRASQIMVSPRLQLLVLFLVLCCTFSIYSSITSAIRPSLFVPCQDENMSNLQHNMTDKVLFRKAVSLPPRLDCLLFDRTPKIAFMFLTKGGLPLSPLWERFFEGHKGHYSIYIHSLPSYRANFDPSSVFYKRHVPSQATQWGRISMCNAERRLLANALLDTSNQRFVLLSESCIPLHNFAFIHDYITNSKYSFVNSVDERGPHGRGRYRKRMSPVINASQWRKGSQWFEVERSLALRIVGDDKYYPTFAKSCRPPCYPDEHYFPTMLSIEAWGSLANRSLTWVDWSRGGAHPGTFGGGDITVEFMKRVHSRSCSYNDRFTSVCHLFGRKFSPNALEPLLLVARKYLGY